MIVRYRYKSTTFSRHGFWQLAVSTYQSATTAHAYCWLHVAIQSDTVIT